MSTKNDEGKEPDNTKPSKEDGAACCAPGCGCGTAAKPGKARWVIGVVVLAAAGLLVVNGMIKSNKGAAQAPAEGFVNPVAEQPAQGAGTPAEAVEGDEKTVGATIGTFSELNTAAAKTDAVFVFLPGKDGSGKAPSAPMKSAARAIEAKGMKCGLFTLKPGSADYEQFAKQLTVPGVVTLVKGRGMSAVSGEVTEAKLLQGYVGACSSSGCGPSASAGCCPK